MGATDAIAKQAKASIGRKDGKVVERTTTGDSQGGSKSVAQSVATLREVADKALPRISDLSFCSFTTFLLLLFFFACWTNIILCVVASRAHEANQELSLTSEVMHYVWMCVQGLLMLDVVQTYVLYYCPCISNASKPKVEGSRFLKPNCWSLLSRCFRIELKARHYLLLLAVIFPINVLFFYQQLGQPVYTPSYLTGQDINSLLASWPNGGGMHVDTQTWSVQTSSSNATFEISTKSCYSYDSIEFQILGRLQHESLPKQAYCESLLGTMMVNIRENAADENSWQRDEDRWEEVFEFSLRMFAALAGIVADSIYETGASFWFLKDISDVFDMYMLTFADVTQMHEGRPLLEGNHVIADYEQSYHVWVHVSIWFAYFAVVLRALASIGFQPHAWLVKSCCDSESVANEIRCAVDATLSLFFIEIPFLVLRFIAFKEYGCIVSIMAVKNVLGIYEDLYLLGILRGFRSTEDLRGLRLCLSYWCSCCCGKGQDTSDLKAKQAAEGGTSSSAV